MIATGEILSTISALHTAHKLLSPRGGGTGHIPPEGIINNQATELRLTFHVWGAGEGRLDKRFTKVACNYRTSTEQVFTRISGRIVHADDETMEMVFVIPPLDLATDDRLHYNFEMMFDGHKNRREGVTLGRL